MPVSRDKSRPLMRFINYNRWSILWFTAIIILTILPGKVFPALPSFMDLFQPDKLVHIFLFAVFFILQVRAFVRQDVFPALAGHAVPVTFIIGLLLGAGTEVMQELFVPMRTGDIYDFIADTAGCLVGWAVAMRFF